MTRLLVILVVPQVQELKMVKGPMISARSSSGISEAKRSCCSLENDRVWGQGTEGCCHGMFCRMPLFVPKSTAK